MSTRKSSTTIGIASLKRMINHRKILGLGHPRTGTGYTAKILGLWGLDVGHEVFGADGIVNWSFVHHSGRYPFSYRWTQTQRARPECDHLIYNVRDPNTSIPSIASTENDPKTEAFNFRKSRMKIDLDNQNPIENAIESIHQFDLKIRELNPSITYRIEDQDYYLYGQLSKYFNITYVQHRTKENTRHHANMHDLIYQYGKPRQEFIDKIEDYCSYHGYPKLF